MKTNVKVAIWEALSSTRSSSVHPLVINVSPLTASHGIRSQKSACCGYFCTFCGYSALPGWIERHISFRWRWWRCWYFLSFHILEWSNILGLEIQILERDRVVDERESLVIEQNRIFRVKDVHVLCMLSILSCPKRISWSRPSITTNVITTEVVPNLKGGVASFQPGPPLSLLFLFQMILISSFLSSLNVDH